MNKKYILCIFVVLIINAFPAYSKPMSKRAEMVPMSKTFDIPPEERMSNTTESFVDGTNVNNLNAIGLLEVIKSDRSKHQCTATVIRTNNGSIAITAAHCLWDVKTKTWNPELYFYPGFNKGRNGKVGKVLGYKWFLYDFTKYANIDYGFIKFYYKKGRKLQDDTGAFDYDVTIPTGTYPTTVFGYPGHNSGNMNCIKDGHHLCEWQGNSTDFRGGEPYRGIPIDTGYGTNGGPWIRNYNPNNTNAGTVMGVTHGRLPYLPNTFQDTVSYAWNPVDFARLLDFAERTP